MAIAAELPDIDTVWSVRGPVESFQHHRGITHTFVGVPFEAGLLVIGFWVWHRWRSGKRRPSELDSPPMVPFRAGMLYLWALVALLSHLLLDYTNNYGLRPFYPFDPHWFAASIVFIFDPYLFVVLLGALVLPYLLGLVGSEVGARRQRFRGRGLAIAALVLMVGWWSFRGVEHAKAMQLCRSQSVIAPVAPAPSAPVADDVAPPDTPPVYLSPQRVLASPDPLSPFAWSTVTDFGPVYQRAEVNTRLNSYQASDVLTPKPAWDKAERSAAASPLGRAYLDWSSMPFLSEQRSEDGSVTVRFEDPRFMGGFMARAGRTPLSGTVTVDRQGDIVEQTMDGRVEH